MSVTTDRFATLPQIWTAMALARAHGHAWAYEQAVSQAIVYDDRTDTRVVDLDRLHAYVEQASDDEPHVRGIYAPDLDADGNIVHETLSGRTRWIVDQDGTATIEICRPHPGHERCGDEGYAVLRAVVPRYADTIDVWVRPGSVFARHVEAFAIALQAVCYPHVWVQAILRLAPFVSGEAASSVTIHHLHLDPA